VVTGVDIVVVLSECEGRIQGPFGELCVDKKVLPTVVKEKKKESKMTISIPKARAAPNH
jgi:hypothetical protein